MRTLSWLLGFCLLLGAAHAADVEVRATTDPSVRVGISGLDIRGFDVGFGVSNVGLDLSVGRRLDLSALGTLSARTTIAATFSGAFNVVSTANGTLGPIALSSSLNAFTAPPSAFDPLAVFSYEPTPTLNSGLLFSATGRYRVQRDLVVGVSGELGADSGVSVFGEIRRDELTLRLGGRTGATATGLLVGATMRGETTTLGVDALLGMNSVGVTGSVVVQDLLGENTSARAYLAFEPWRTAALPLRYGADVTLPVARGALTAGVRGGTGNVGLRVSYAFPLGGPDDEE
ncbi:hypothetical protein [Deinococcus yavapaiensis]|uniref:Uncharacterized protein n=1 Tax=Deinococcus yavapaiensis KR-236 TaxID=694435 RepID=A0A318S8V3_9DEIO|nr:hypothetical protein [Deinococcus yavapaiensis]PYE54387.1 hypothetical protein DES52_10524 [Deinococcus yavapaiensis KR-236]